MSTQVWISMNTAPVIGLLYLYIFLWTNASMDEKLKRDFYWLMGLEVLELLFYNLELVTAGMAYPTPARILFSAFGYTLRGIMACLIFQLATKQERQKKKRILLTIPLVLNTVAAFSVFFTDLAYSYTADNRFVRGPLGFTSQIVITFYLLMVVVQTLKNAKKNPVLESFIVITTVIFLIASMVIEATIRVRSVGRTAIVLSTIFYYMYYQTQEYKQTLSEGELLQKKLERKSRTDGLTGLLNKGTFMEEAERILEEEDRGSCALIFFDLDHFKSVNDFQGHIAGDELLKTIAGRMREAFRREDLLGRFGGDEFYVLMKNITYENLDRRMQSMLKGLQLQSRGEQGSIYVTASIGCAYLEEGKAADIEKLLALADGAVYEAKESGRNQYVIRKV